MQKIITNSEASINDSIQTGQHIRNGFNRLFKLEVGETEVTLTSIGGEKDGKQVTMSRKVFVQLYYRKNYDQVKDPKNFMKEVIASHSVGGSRFMIGN